MKINSRNIGGNSPCYLIAEISHNHQGNESEVKKIVEAAAAHGANAVKFQKRDNATLFLAEFYNKPYDTENSFGKTYGEHREFLEPKITWLKEANKQTHELGLDFIMTVFDEASLMLCEKELSIDAYKIQSADLTNLYLIEKVAATKKPYFISCGAASLAEIEASYKYCTELKTAFCLMYAVSEYPTKDANVNLARMVQLKATLKTDLIGFSCHHLSIEPAILSRALGVVAVEKHFTLSKDQKGPDHKLSLTPDELKELKRRLALTDTYLGSTWEDETGIEAYQLDARYKMGKCAVAARDILEGQILTETDLDFKSPMQGLNPSEVKKLIGMVVSTTIRRGELIENKNLK